MKIELTRIVTGWQNGKEYYAAEVREKVDVDTIAALAKGYYARVEGGVYLGIVIRTATGNDVLYKETIDEVQHKIEIAVKAEIKRLENEARNAVDMVAYYKGVANYWYKYLCVSWGVFAAVAVAIALIKMVA